MIHLGLASGPGSTRRPTASSPTGNKADDRPRIEDFLAQEAGPRRALLLQELLRVERELRNSAGEMPGPPEYHQRFPDDLPAVDAVFGHNAHVDPPAKPRIDAAQSLLFGLLALHNNFIDRDALLAAFNAWVVDKSQFLGQILLDRGSLTPARHALLQALVLEHLQQHGFDAERSLAVVTVASAVRDGLEDIPDFDLRASLIHLCQIGDTDEDTDSERTASCHEDNAATDAEGRFRIIRFHDRGALGEVFVARDQQLHRMVAVKRIKLDHASDKDKRPGLSSKPRSPAGSSTLASSRSTAWDLRRRPPVLRHAVHPRRQP